ncbi:MAG: biopolymer transporter ExbD [Opitutales bacterium]|nr:biopolymer transporter ExbD [Opitutales bacterium]
MSKRGSLSSRDDAEVSDINISPLIDMVFILLIFFIVVTVFVEEPGVEVQRERAFTAAQLERMSILFAVTEGGEVYYGGDDIGIVGVRGVVRRLTSQTPAMPIIIQVDRGAPSGIVIRVIDESKLASPPSIVSLSTDEQRGR